MGKSSGTAPKAPDPYATAAAQGAEDRKTLQYGLENSRTSTVNPFGSTSWANNKTFDQAGFDTAMKAYRPAVAAIPGTADINGGMGDFTRGTPGTAAVAASGIVPDREAFTHNNWVNTQKLSPESQGIYDTSTAKLNQNLANFNPDDVNRLKLDPGLATDSSRYNQAVADAVFSRMRRYTAPEDARARTAMQTNLADRGFQVGNEGYNTEMTRLDDSQGQGRADAADRAQITGASQGLNEFGAENTAKLNNFVQGNAAIQGKLTLQQQIASAMSNLRNQQVAGVSGMPSTTTTPSIQAPDIAGMINGNYANEMNAYNAQQASNNATTGGLLSLAGTAAGAFLGPGGAAAGGALGKALGGGGGAAAPSLSGTGIRAPRGGGFWG